MKERPLPSPFRAAALAARILCCPDCHGGLNPNLLCESCGRSFVPASDGIISALPAAMERSNQSKAELQRLIDSSGAGEHGEKVVLYERAFHDEQAPYYDRIFADPLPLGEYYKSLVREQIYSLVRGSEFVVDLCCGTGKSSIPLLERGIPVVAMDVSREMLRIYAGKCAARGLSRVVLIHADASNPPLAAVSCGAISMVGGLHHIRDQQCSVNACCQALVPGGLLILHEPLKTGSTTRWAKFLENLYALLDPARVWQALKRRIGFRSGRPAAPQHAPVPDFTPYEKPFGSADELRQILPESMKTVLLRSQGLLSFRDFPPLLQNRLGVLVARWIFKLDVWLSRTGRTEWAGDALFAVFRREPE
jgi:SAM-dependent methyltransferase